MGRRHRARGASHAVVALIAVAALRPDAVAQDEPAHWAQFVHWREELAADATAALADWAGKADARLAWLHAYVTADRSDAEFDRWLAPDAVATLQHLHAVLRTRPATDLARTFLEVLHLVDRLKDRGRFDAAADLLEGVLAWQPPDRPERVDFLLQLAECQRRAYRWDQAAQTLAAAGAAGSDAVPLHTQRAALLLARGLPDLAVAEVEAAERAATDPARCAQALFVRLRLEHALQRPERAMAAVRTFLAAPVPAALAADAGWSARCIQLRIRAALAVLADPQDVAPERDEAVRWLRDAIAAAETTNDERILARTVLASHLLDRLELADVDALLAAAAAALPVEAHADLDERRLAVATLSLRHARLAGLATDVLRARAAELASRWHLLVERWHEQPISRVGEGPLFFGDCRRAFVELLRWRLAADDAAAGVDAALVEVMRASATGSLARQLGAVAPSPAAVRASCRDGAAILVFVPGHEASLLLAIDRAGTTAHVLATGTDAMDRRRRELLRALEAARQGGDAAELQAAARACGQTLLPAALAPQLAAWTHVAIVGLESLGYLPFELLPGPSGAPLGTSHAISYLPSLPVAAWLAAHRPALAPSATPRIRVVACPDAPVPATATDRPPPLPFTPSDLAAQSDACAGLDVEILRGAAATRAAAFGAGRDVDLVQVIAHGMRDESRADPQGVLLGDGSIAWPGDIETLTCPRYVFLDVCRAGRGRLRRGDDGRHLLSGAVLIAGARAVVLPVVDVGYRTTLAFAADVHHALWQERCGLAEALRRARASAWARGGADRFEPLLFHLVGLGDEPLLARDVVLPGAHRNLALGACLFALLATAIVLTAVRRRGRTSPDPRQGDVAAGQVRRDRR